MEELELPVRRGKSGLGIVVSPQNILLELTRGGMAFVDAQLRVGDHIVGIDSQPLRSTIRDHLAALPQLSVHAFLVRRAVSSPPNRDDARQPLDDDDDDEFAGKVRSDDDEDDTIVALQEPHPGERARASCELCPAPVSTLPSAATSPSKEAVPTNTSPSTQGSPLASPHAVPALLLAPSGERFKLNLDIRQLHAPGELYSAAARAWQEATGETLRVSPRVQCLLSGDERLLLTPETPVLSLHLILQIRVSAAAQTLGATPSVGSQHRSAHRSVGGESGAATAVEASNYGWLADAGDAASKALRRTLPSPPPPTTPPAVDDSISPPQCGDGADVPTIAGAVALSAGAGGGGGGPIRGGSSSARSCGRADEVGDLASVLEHLISTAEEMLAPWLAEGASARGPSARDHAAIDGLRLDAADYESDRSEDGETPGASGAERRRFAPLQGASSRRWLYCIEWD